MDLDPKLVLVSGRLMIVSRQPGGAKGTQLNSCGISKTWYADSWGRVSDVRSILSVSCAFLINLHHSIDGTFSSHVLRSDTV